MGLIKITDLSTTLGISSRSLRYYEQVGLIGSVRPEFEKYRYYDHDAVERLKQIMILRKMQIPIKDILRIYESQDMSTVVSVFVDKIKEIDHEVNALNELRSIVNEFLQTMLKNGIRKISALPLLYEEMDKQLSLKEDPVKSFSYDELSAVSEKMAKPLDIRLVELPSMRVVSSYLKDSQKEKSEADAWYRWIEQNKLPRKPVGSHEHFDFLDTVTGNFVCMRRIAEDFHNDSPFLDFTFTGGLFAVLGTYWGDDTGKAYDDLKDYIENKLDAYMLDYPYIKANRIDCLGEEVLSPFDDKGRYELYMPVKRRTVDVTGYKDAEDLPDISLGEIEMDNRRLLTEKVKLDSLVSEAWSHTLNEDGELVFSANMDFQGMMAPQKYRIPFRVDMVAKTINDNSIRLNWGKGAVILNWENDGGELRAHDPIFGKAYGYKERGSIPVNRYVNLSWIVGEKYFAVIVDGEVRHCGTNYPYMQTLQSEAFEHPVRISSLSRDIYTSYFLHIRSLDISTIKPRPRVQISKGRTAPVGRQSNNVLPDLHNLVTWHFGQNYPFNGCMAYLLECQGESREHFDYWLFSGVSGDIYTMVYGNNGAFNDCVSVVLGGPEYIGGVFDAIGYEHTYVTEEHINMDKNRYIQMLMAYIDRGVPVLSRGIAKDYTEYQVLCGYEEDGSTLLFLKGDSTEPLKLDVTETITQDWIFVGERKKNVPLAEIYRNAVMQMPRFLTMPKSANGCTFGAQAFYDWACDIGNGRYDGLTAETFDPWRDYTVFICNLATNTSCRSEFFKKALACNPDMSCVVEIESIFDEMGALWKQLEAIGGSFNVTLGSLQDRQKCWEFAQKIREIGKCSEKLLAVTDK